MDYIYILFIIIFIVVVFVKYFGLSDKMDSYFVVYDIDTNTYVRIVKALEVSMTKDYFSAASFSSEKEGKNFVIRNKKQLLYTGVKNIAFRKFYKVNSLK